MSYEKRVCVLKQVKKGFTADGSALSGAVYCERLGEELTLTPRLLGLAPVREGRYALAVWVEGNLYLAELSPAVRLRTPSIRGGVAVLLAYLKHDPEPIAFGNCGLAPNSWEALLPAFGVSTEKEAPMPEEEKDTMPAQEEVSTDMPPFREAKSYDDEAIASADYFGGEGRGDEDASPAGEDETFAPISFGARLAYYESVRDRLERAFSSYPRDERLLGIFPHSEWVRTEGGLLGVIYEEGRPRYLCVAAEDPPAEMRKRSLFVPLSPFGEGGIYVVFQSADTGDYIGVEEG